MNYKIHETRGKSITMVKIEATDRKVLDEAVKEYARQYPFAGYMTEERDRGGKFTRTEPGFVYIRRFSSCE